MNGEAGFGISSTIALEVSQSFFVEMTLPFSVIQNEQSDVIVNVFSYLNTCVEVSCSHFPCKTEDVIYNSYLTGTTLIEANHFDEMLVSC